MPNTKLTKARMKNHWHYSKMIYLAVVVIAAMLADVLFTATTYRAPNERRVDIHMISHYINFELDTRSVTDEMLAHGQSYETERDRAAGIDVNAANYEPALQEVTVVGVMYDENSEDSYYQQQKYALTLAAQEGDIFILSREMMNGLAETGYLTDLTPYIESGLLNIGDMKQAMYYEYTEPDEEPSDKKCVYGLATDELTGLYRSLGVDHREKYMVILNYCANPDTAASIMQWMIDEYTGVEIDIRTEEEVEQLSDLYQ